MSTRIEASMALPIALASVVLAVAALALPCAVRAAERAVTVSAIGEVKTRPTNVEIAILASGSAELSSDALVKYRTSVRRTLDAFSKLKIENLRIDQGDLTVGGPIRNNNNGEYIVQTVAEPGGEAAVHTPVNISRRLRLRLSGIQTLKEDQLIDTIVRLVDIAKDSGNTIVGDGSQAMVTFSADQADALRDKASQAAFAQARARAAKYAELAGARLGDVLSVEEIATEMSETSVVWSNPYGMQMPGGYYSTSASGKLVSSSLGEIPMRVTLRVRFAMNPASPDEKK
jgi:uncharacterized protein YggE